MLILKLLLAHIIGDFVLQPSKWVKHKEKHKLSSKYLYYHTAIHLTLVFIAYDCAWQKYISILTIVLSHYAIDVIKLYKPLKNKGLLFALDQISHLLIIWLVANNWQLNFELSQLNNEFLLLLLLSLFMLTSVSNIVLKLIFSKWEKEIKISSENDSSLKDAGKYIGILERILIFLFVVLNQWEAIGFLLAAKSVFRFGDLSKSNDRTLTEYILIGTLLSFSIAIATGMVYKFLITII